MKRAPILFNIRNVLLTTLSVTRARQGFVSQKQATEDPTLGAPTSKFVLNLLRESAPFSASPEDQTLVDEIIAHFGNVDTTNSNDPFLIQVQQFISIGSVPERCIGFIVSLPNLYEKKVYRTNKLTKFADKYANSLFMGTLSERAEFFVKLLDTVKFVKNGETLYIYRVADQNNNFGYFFSKEQPEKITERDHANDKDISSGLGLKMFDCFVIKATPKKYAINKDTGLRETQFSRVRVVEIIGQGSTE